MVSGEVIFGFESLFDDSSLLFDRSSSPGDLFGRLNNDSPGVAVGTPVDLTPPAQIRTCRIAACGSYLGCLASKRRLG